MDSWTSSFMEGRSYHVNLEGGISTKAPVRSGASQVHCFSLKLVDKCIGSRIHIIMKNDKEIVGILLGWCQEGKDQSLDPYAFFLEEIICIVVYEDVDGYTFTM
ncbi:LSM5-like protein, partial [Mya arenaria]